MSKSGRPPVERRTVQCAACGTDLVKRVSDLARNKTGRLFCSKECQDKVGAKPRRGWWAPCEQCGESLYRTPSVPKKYCSTACHDQAQRVPEVTATCRTCGKEFQHKRSVSRRFCSNTCKGVGRVARPLDRLHNDKPARLNAQGYVLVWEPDHPASASYGGWVFEHRVVAERELCRPLTSADEVHHINRDKTDNRPVNLAVLSGPDHGYITALDNWRDLRALQALVDRYQALYGELPPEERD